MAPSSSQCPTQARATASRAEGNEDVLREAIVVVMGADFTVETMVDPSALLVGGRTRAHPKLQSRPPHPSTAATPQSLARTTNGAPNSIYSRTGCGREPRRQRSRRGR